MTSRLFAVCVAVWTVFTPVVYAQRSIASVLGELDKVRSLHEACITPDGHRSAWVEDVTGGTEIYVLNEAHGDMHRISAATDDRAHTERGLAWAADSRMLAFLSDAVTPGQLQVFVVDVSKLDVPRRVTSVKGQLAHALWSPDGKQIAVLFVAGSTQETGALAAYKPDAGVVGDVIEEQRIAIVDVATGAIREVSPPNLYV